MATAAQHARWLKKMAVDQRTVLRLIARRQPITGTAAAADLGWSLDRWWAAAWRARKWWDVTGTGLVLTAAGRDAAAELPPKGE